MLLRPHPNKELPTIKRTPQAGSANYAQTEIEVKSPSKAAFKVAYSMRN